MRVVPSFLVAALIVGFTAVPAAADTAPLRLIVGVTHDADRAALVGEIGDLADDTLPARPTAARTAR